MINYNKTLLILILVLSVIIVGEFYYLFFVQTAESRSVTNQPDKVVEKKSHLCLPHLLYQLLIPEQEFNEDLFYSLRTLRKGMIESSTLTYVLKGIIAKIDYRTEGEKRAIDVSIKANNGDMDRFRFPDTNLVSLKDLDNRKIDLFKIKQNDTVTITIQFDMIKIDYQNVIIQIP